MRSLRESLISAKDWHKIDSQTPWQFDLENKDVRNQNSFDSIRKDIQVFINGSNSFLTYQCMMIEEMVSEGYDIEGFLDSSNKSRLRIIKGKKKIRYETIQNRRVEVDGKIVKAIMHNNSRFVVDLREMFRKYAE